MDPEQTNVNKNAETTENESIIKKAKKKNENSSFRYLSRDTGSCVACNSHLADAHTNMCTVHLLKPNQLNILAFLPSAEA